MFVSKEQQWRSWVDLISYKMERPTYKAVATQHEKTSFISGLNWHSLEFSEPGVGDERAQYRCEVAEAAEGVVDSRGEILVPVQVREEVERQQRCDRTHTHTERKKLVTHMKMRLNVSAKHILQASDWCGASESYNPSCIARSQSFLIEVYANYGQFCHMTQNNLLGFNNNWNQTWAASC